MTPSRCRFPRMAPPSLPSPGIERSDCGTSREHIGTLKGHTDRVNSVSFSRDGATVASGSDDGTIKLWEVATKRNTTTFEGHADGVGSVAFSSQSNILAAGVTDGSIKLWDVESKGVIDDLDKGGAFASVAYSRYGTIFALASGRTIRLWDVATEQPALSCCSRTRKWFVWWNPSHYRR